MQTFTNSYITQTRMVLKRTKIITIPYPW